jgi:phage terminase small subunit
VSGLLRVDPYGPNAAEIAEVRRRLTPQEALFIDNYLVDLDEARSAAAVGLPPKKGKSVLNRYYVRRALELITAERRHRLGVTQDRIVEEYAKIGFANIGDYIRPDEAGNPYLAYRELDSDQKAAISEMTIEEYVEGRGEDARAVKRTKFKLHDKKAALDSLGRYLGMFVDRTEIRGAMEVKLMNLSRAERLAMMRELLEGARKYLPAAEITDAEYEEMLGQ